MKGFLVEPFIPHPLSRWFYVSLALRVQLGLKTIKKALAEVAASAKDLISEISTRILYQRNEV